MNYIFLFLFLIGGILSCQKKTITNQESQIGTVTDVNGNVYQTIKIGSQWWMAENLKVTTYNDSTPILHILKSENDSIWRNLSEGAMTILSGGTSVVYNWYAVSNLKGIAPKGWHIPTDEEWRTLEKEIGMSSTEADKTGWRGTNVAEKLMIKSSTGWPVDGVFGSNSFGFTALSTGCRFVTGESTSGNAFWWTSTLNNSQPYYRYIDGFRNEIFRHFTYKTAGYSIRCIKD